MDQSSKVHHLFLSKIGEGKGYHKGLSQFKALLLKRGFLCELLFRYTWY